MSNTPIEYDHEGIEEGIEAPVVDTGEKEPEPKDLEDLYTFDEDEIPAGDDDSAGGDDKPATGDSESQTATESAFDDALLARAEQFGFSREEAQEFGSQELLTKWLDRTESVVAATRETPGEQTGASETGGDDSSAAGDDDALTRLESLNLDPEVFDERLVDVVGQMKGIMKDAISAKDSKIAELTQMMENFVGQQFERELDSYFSGLGEDYKELFGSGPGASMDKKSTAFANRNKFLDEVAAQMDTNIRMKRGLSREQVFERALNAAFGKEVATINQKKIGKSLDRRSRNLTVPPTRREASKHNKTPMERAVAFEMDFLRSRGYVD